MGHLEVVRTDDMPARRKGQIQSAQDARMHLPNIDLATYGRMMAEHSEDYVLMRRRARIDARRLVHDLRARHPVREIGNVCVWDLVGDVLCCAIPVADRFRSVELAAHALRMMVGLMTGGGCTKAMASMGEVILDMTFEHDEGRFTMTMVQGGVRLRLDFVMEQGSFVLSS